MTEHRIGTQEEWQAERDELLKEEKELTRRGDELAGRGASFRGSRSRRTTGSRPRTARRPSPICSTGAPSWSSTTSCSGRPGPAGCPVCSSIADTLDPQVAHLKARDTTLLLASRAPLEKLLAYRERMGWGIDWVSSGGSDFNRDLGFLYTRRS